MATTMRVTIFYFILIYYSICTIRGSILFFFLGKLGGLKFNTLEREREKREIERGQIE